MATDPPSITVWHWNCRCLQPKRAVLQQHIEHAKTKPDVVLLQETLTATPTLPGYRVQVGAAGGSGLCTLVRKGLTFLEHEIKNKIAHVYTEIIPTKSNKKSLFFMNVYSSPSQKHQRFKSLLHKAGNIAKDSKILACGDFNMMNQSWCYLINNVKGRNLAQDATELDYILITDPAYTTRIGNSASRDTTPDLTFVKNDADAVIKCKNTGDNLGSDHVLVEITLPVPDDQKSNVKKYTWIDNSEFRMIRDREEVDVDVIDDIDEWTDKIARNVREATKETETDMETEAMDSRLAHLIEAKKAIQDRWKKQRLNRRLRKKVAELNKEIENHCRVLSNQKWNEMCCAVDGQLHNGKAWNLLKHLMDETKTTSHQREILAKLLHREVTENVAEAVTHRLRNRYVPTTPTVVHGPYRGRSNKRLDRDIEVEEIRTALHYLNTRSAPGPDRITNKILRNLDDKSIENLTAYYNKCWRSGKLPEQWKKSKTILMPKPGKLLSTDNLRPITLTSHVGKAMEHVLHNRWQEYLEGEKLYVEIIIGFRQYLSTQDAMIQIRHQIIDDQTRENKAILGLDLESAFDKVTHAAVLRQVSELNMGERS
ncbi:uncharacterized protein LOC144160658 [Haemaphysalis longicornis]